MHHPSRRLAAVLVLAITAACEKPGRAESIPAAPRDVLEATSGFAVPCVPGDSIFITPALVERRDWYGKAFRDLGQARFCLSPAGVDEAYRFTWIPSFTPAIGVTLERRGSAWTLTSRSADQPFRYPSQLPDGTLVPPPPAGPPRVRTRALRPDEVAALEAALRQARFWSMVPSVKSPGLDGVEWVMEGARAGRYHAVDRWSPVYREGDEAYAGLGRVIFHLAGVPSREIDVDAKPNP